AALARGEKSVGSLKITLTKWMSELLLGPWNEAYVERRARIGRVHVRIALPQHYMVSAMNVMRTSFEAHVNTREERRAVEKACDIDLALMLHTYREDLEAAQARAERLATYGQLVASIGHELRNPLGVIETSLYVLKSRPDNDERATKHLTRIGEQVKLSSDIITQLLNLIADRPLGLAQTTLEALVEDARRSVTVPAEVTFEVTGVPSPLRCDVLQMRQAILNLLENAVWFASPNGRVQVTMRSSADQVELAVDDSGPGVDPDIRARIFEPLVSSRPGGTGLGLALVKRVVEKHGGDVSVDKSLLGGARFSFRVPVKERP
ncbi:MAG: ATP-binding protein, partial [Archangium sp.]